MKSKINISIPEPCHENWQAMTSVEKGKFCGSCQKNVFDFTKATDRQIIEAYNKDNKLCGRFLNTQLNRDLVTPKEKGSIWLATTSTLFSLLAFGNNEVKAQETPKTEQTETKHLLGKPAQQQEVQTNEEREITGIVSDATGAMPGVIVVVKGTQRSVSTDFDGKYSIKAKEGETLVFSFMGMEEENLIIGNSSKYNITMKEIETRLMGDMIIMVGGISAKRKTFFGRKFHKIGNWFK
ncbi:carboxypeptidase-like regulatory domain-containing protein [Flavobacterium sp.]|uniref:carboxypeptidase-like regulatory domain-containing protein n=1 Tax=Flavobacterium sp. TaxID=239 RepID=UPI003750AD48